MYLKREFTWIQKVLTGMPPEVRIVVTSVGEKSIAEFAFAAMNLASTKAGRDSDSPRSILRMRGWFWIGGLVDGMVGRWWLLLNPQILVCTGHIRHAVPFNV